MNVLLLWSIVGFNFMAQKQFYEGNVFIFYMVMLEVFSAFMTWIDNKIGILA